MARSWRMLGLLCSMAWMWAGALLGVQLALELDPQSLVTDHPITADIVVTHADSEKIDPSSLLVGTLSIAAEKVSESTSGKEVKTVLRFTLPPQPSGLHLLPALSLKVGDQRFTTVAQTYSVGSAPNITGTGTVNFTMPNMGQGGVYGSTPKGDAWIKFESVVQGPKILYPGQKTVVGYRYIYHGNISLDEEKTPLLSAEGFRKIGETHASEYVDQSFNTLQALQQIEATEPGEFAFPEGYLKGTAYISKTNPLEKAQTIPLEAKAAPVTLTVKAFPAEDKPKSFNGAVGNYEFNVRMLTLPEVTVGGKITLSLEITGAGDLTDLPMPDLCCQPGFSGNFQQSDIPPIGVVKEHTKYFVADMRPLTAGIKEIPSIEFSFWNPETGHYEIKHSQPIPITVLKANTPYSSALQKDSNVKPFPVEGAPQEEEKFPKESSQPQPAEINTSAHIGESSLSSRQFSNAWVLLLIPLLLIFIWYQYQLKRSQAKKEATPVIISQSAQWLKKAEMAGQDVSQVSHAVERALINLLYEKGQISSPEINAQQLPAEGKSGKVRHFITSLEEQRYTGSLQLTAQQILQQGQELYYEL